MAKQQAGALSALKVKPMYGEAIEEDDDVDEAMRRVMDAYTARQQRNYDPYLMAIGQGLLASRGNFGEAVGMASKSYEDMQSKLRQEEIDTSAANLQLAQSRRDQALMRQKSKATAGLFGGTSGEGASDDYGDQDAVSFLVANGMPRKEAVNLLVQEGVRPSQKLSETGIGMDAMKRYAKYVTTYGNDENAKALMEMMKLQNQQFTYQNGVRVNNLTGKAEYVQPEGLPPSGAKDIELFMGDGTYKVDSRTAKLYEFANNQGPEVAQAFVKAYKEKGTVPKDIVDKYNAQQSGGKAPAGGEEFSPERLNSTLTALEMKSPAFASPVALSGEQPPLQKGVKFNQDEAKVMASMFRIGNAKSVEELSPFDFQVFAALQAKAKPPVELAAPSEVEKAAAAPAAVKLAAPPAPPPAAAAPAAAPVPAVKAAAVVPPAKAAAVSEAPAAAPAGVAKPAPPKVFSPAPLPPNPSAEAKLKYETEKAAAEAKTRADVERYKIEMQQFNLEKNRPANVEAGVEEAVLKKRGELAEVDEQTFVKSLNTSRQMKSASLRVLNNVIKNPKALGLLADPGLFNAVASLVSDGISLGNTTVKLADAEGALAKVMPDMTKQDLQSRSEISKDLAEIELLYTREFLTGQGAVTENERKIVRNLGGTVSDSPTVLARRIELLVAKAKHNQDKVTAFQDWRNDKTKSKGLTINDWMASPEARKIDAAYDKTTDSLYNKFFGKPATTTSSGEAVPPQLKNAKEALLESLRKK
jgi:hypothetical protein